MLRLTGERGYLTLVRRVLRDGTLKSNRTGVDTKYIFGDQLRYDLRDNRLAMLTTKKVFFRSALEELLWFLRGDTNQANLAAKGVNIWRGNSTREYLDSRKLSYPEHESLGPIYGFQWRHFGARYIDCHTDYTGQGVDQLAQCMHQIQYEPSSRRMIMTAWNPNDLDKMVLPPCHMSIQFSVNEKLGELSGHMTQRSADLMLGVPFNLVSYSLMLHILAHKFGLKAGELVTSYGDLHIYVPHIKNAMRQVSRLPYASPQIELKFGRDKRVEELTADDFAVKNYRHHSQLDYEMAA